MNSSPQNEFTTLVKLKAQTPKHYKASLLVRCLNEMAAIERFHESLKIQSIFNDLEIIFLDSGSTDGTIEFLLSKNVSLYTIAKHEFSFSRTCNLLLSLSSTEHNFFFSAHIYILNRKMLEETLSSSRKMFPAIYFRQVVNEHTGYNNYEKSFLKKAFPVKARTFDASNIRRLSFSNAASYVSKSIWLKHQFPDIAASEDHVWAKAVLDLGYEILYLADFAVEHSHNEGPAQVEKRVRINKISRYGTKAKPFTAALKFFGVYLSMIKNGGNIKESYLYALSHARGYM